MQILLATVAAYLIGSVSFAVVVSAAMGLADPRSYGSKNPGATNVLRSGNKKAAILTLVGDAFKGWLAVWLVKRFGIGGEIGVALAAIAVFLGHLYPVFFRFQGGKGVATAAGVLLAVHPALGLATALTWLIVAFFFRYSSLAALVAAVFAPIFDVFLFGTHDNPVAWAVLAMSVLLIWRHRSNISKLLAGEESRIGQKKKRARDSCGRGARRRPAARCVRGGVPRGTRRRRAHRETSNRGATGAPARLRCARALRAPSTSASGRRSIGACGLACDAPVRASVAEVVEIERRIGHFLAQQCDRALQIVALRAGHAHRVALDARLHLDLAVLHDAHDFFARSPDTPFLIVTTCLTLSPPIFSILP